MTDIVERLGTVGLWGEAREEILLLRAEVAALRDVLLRSGFRECDIPACNCVGRFAERFREIDEATRDEYRNGETLLSRIKRMAALVDMYEGRCSDAALGGKEEA